MGIRTGHARVMQDCLQVFYVNKIVGSPYLNIIHAQLSATGYTAIIQVQNVQKIVRTRTTCVLTVFPLQNPKTVRELHLTKAYVEFIFNFIL